ncbi:MAG: 50S ribosomal protein L21 [Chitinispirillaceae bacterium]|nr:50S ribosomal protein L21 [Chitinispirillaceae bacterium]
MYSIIEQGGFQYKVKVGDKIKVPFLNVPEGTEVTIDKVLLLSDEYGVKIGNPVLEGVTLTAKVLGDSKYKKILIIKRKRRKDYKRKKGHRQSYTRLEIVSINKG